ncbi:MAG TPA: GNAT family N-acetyltransferase [Thermoanaerobaculia bacterium]|nr:GNAT family N-acetyltransferase [Thermoanaerobaculia bacterium]
MLRTATRADLPALRDLFARANDAPYDLAPVIEEKCFGDGVAGSPTVRIYGDFLGAAVTCGRYLRLIAVERNARRRGIGSALLNDSNARVIGAEAGNYFTPGVVTSDDASLAFFRARGYDETQRTNNLEVALEAHEIERVARATHNDRDRLLTFIEKEFGRIWRFEAARAFERDTPTAFFATHDQQLAGFAVHDANNRGLGTFGPTGVVSAMRGRGFGCALLRASLHDLHTLGYTRAIIPWTDALDFYRKCCGAAPVHQFVTLAKLTR